MLFESQESREHYLEQIVLNPATVSYGSAMYHARSTNLGAWGDREMLRVDCAKIMAAEVMNFFVQELCKPTQITWEHVLEVNAFNKAFNIVRRSKSAELDNFVRTLGDNHTHMQERDESIGYGENLTISKAYEAVAMEIIERVRRERIW